MPERPGAAENHFMQATLTSIRRPFLLIKGNHHVFLSYLQATPDYEDAKHYTSPNPTNMPSPAPLSHRHHMPHAVACHHRMPDAETAHCIITASARGATAGCCTHDGSHGHGRRRSLMTRHCSTPLQQRRMTPKRVFGVRQGRSSSWCWAR